MKKSFKRLTRQIGAGTGEYAILILLVAIVATSSSRFLGQTISGDSDRVRQEFEDAAAVTEVDVSSPGFAFAGGGDSGDSVGGEGGSFALTQEGGGTIAVGGENPGSQGCSSGDCSGITVPSGTDDDSGR